MSTSTRVGLVLLGLAALALAGCAGPQAGEEATVIERNETIAAGSFVELNLAMNESAELTYMWEAANATELAFDVHSHDGDETVYHEQATASSREGSFTAPSQGTYSLLWENRGQEAATVAIHVEGEIHLVSVVP